MISLLINTFNRYENIHKILEIELEYKIVSEVLVFNNGDQPIDIKHRKLKIIKANYDVGLRSRWILGALARQNCLFVQDDDLLVNEEVFDVVHGNYLFDYDKVYGIYGRKIDPTGFYSMDKSPIGEADVVLTRFACFDKSLIPYLLESEDAILPFRYPTATEFPYDDILLSYTSERLYGKKPYIIKVDGIEKLTKELPNERSIHLSDGYVEKRKQIISLCRSRFMNENYQYPTLISE